MIEDFVLVVNEVEKNVGIVDINNNGWELTWSDFDDLLSENSDLVSTRNIISLEICDD